MAKEKKQDSGWQFPKALEIVKCKEGNKEFMKERPARRPFGNTVLIQQRRFPRRLPYGGMRKKFGIHKRKSEHVKRLVLVASHALFVERLLRPQRRFRRLAGPQLRVDWVQGRSPALQSEIFNLGI